MHHNPKWFHFTKNLESSLLAEEESTLLSLQTKTKDIDDLSAITCLRYINDKICMFRSGLQLIRWIIFIPWLLGLLISATHFTSDFYKNWLSEENRITSEIVAINNTTYPVTNAWGEVFYKKYGDDRMKKLTSYIGNDMKMSFNEYLYYRYNEYAYGGEYLTGDIIHTIYYIIFIPLSLYLSFLIKRKAPLILVRNRQLFMTWINGKAFVARYSQVGVVETPQAVSLILYGLDDKKNIIKTAFVLPTNPTIIISTKQGRKNILAFITKYMLWGQSAVASTDYERDMPYYFRKDKKPDDFEQQVSDVLAVLDKLESPRELNTLTDKSK
ncbi:hypothetical protein [Hafnia paralvei]|uniref:Uncharacterized protein n=1 Tax=Hafnia paralvei TaxID=546367 RepID=A0A4Q9EP86_9GAMM|nr:hypothetical protein [Hafnia paralvei]TBM26942.1 hypothetical protein EYY89_10210 [Hafnia paralvei]